jgi:hypothetical protein
MPILAKTRPILLLTIIASTHCFAKSPEYKTINQAEDLDTTTVHFYIKNLTPDILTLSKPSQKQIESGSLSWFNTPPKKRTEFATDYANKFSAIPRSSPAVLTETFAFASGKKECQFTASIQVAIVGDDTQAERVPHWSGTARSIGTEEADCSTEILEIMNDFPYSYSIEFSME